jgi:hypothetical protein
LPFIVFNVAPAAKLHFLSSFSTYSYQESGVCEEGRQNCKGEHSHQVRFDGGPGQIVSLENPAESENGAGKGDKKQKNKKNNKPTRHG